MARIIVLNQQWNRSTVQDLKMVECDLWEAEEDAKKAGLDKMSDCLGRMKAAIRSMLADLGEK
jgi:hypothetical protein